MQELLPEWHQNVLKRHGQGVTGKDLPIDLLQLHLIEHAHRRFDLFLPLRVVSLHQFVGNDMRQRLKRGSLGQYLADLADGDATFDPAQDAADPLDIGHCVQAMPAFGAHWLNQTITSLPRPQGDRIDARQP
ncbi:hypothetical protein D3C84_527460 [compost metagenome]